MWSSASLPTKRGSRLPPSARASRGCARSRAGRSRPCRSRHRRRPGWRSTTLSSSGSGNRVRRDSKISRKPGAVEHLLDGDDPCREHAQASRVQAAGQVLGEHGKALLGLVVAGQSDGQQLQRLPGAVLVGDDMGADLVVQRAARHDRREDAAASGMSSRPKDTISSETSSRTSKLTGKSGYAARYRSNSSLSRIGERPGRDGLRAGSLGRDGLEQLLRSRARGAVIASVELQRPVHEPRGVTILQGGDLSCDLVPLRPEEACAAQDQ